LASGAGLHEIAIFHAYHAFESICCAALALGETVPRAHSRKIERFLVRYRRLPFAPGVAALAAAFGQARNQSLYPSPSGIAPRHSLTSSEASRLIRRVGGVVVGIARAPDF
jgi:hypothetical protein